MPLPDPIIEVLTAFRPLFTAPTWRKLMTLLAGTLLTRGRRTITAALRATGNEQAANFSVCASNAQSSLLVPFSSEPSAACADRADLRARGDYGGSGDRRNVGATLGTRDQETRPLSG